MARGTFGNLRKGKEALRLSNLFRRGEGMFLAVAPAPGGETTLLSSARDTACSGAFLEPADYRKRTLAIPSAVIVQTSTAFSGILGCRTSATRALF